MASQAETQMTETAGGEREEAEGVHQGEDAGSRRSAGPRVSAGRARDGLSEGTQARSSTDATVMAQGIGRPVDAGRQRSRSLRKAEKIAEQTADSEVVGVV